MANVQAGKEVTGRVLVLLTAIMLSCSASFAGIGDNFLFEAGVELDNVTYKEPGYMKESGFLWGIRGTAAFNIEDWSVLAAGSLVWGDLTYDGGYYADDGTLVPLTLETPNNILNLRLESSWHFSPDEWAPWRVSAVYGIAWRYLVDDLPGIHGYTREQHYYFAPIGLDVEYAMESGSVWGGRAEYDWFLGGENTSGGSDFTQTDGAGVRVATYFVPALETDWTYSVEMFYQYWTVEESSVSPDGYVEPRNNSRMIGVALSAVL